ncbi:hypothetical protein B4N84_23495 [Flavobacterium sp. IR1]|jgi:putative Mn2+ efflux pump MntP|uniref:Uncharacterized protein n=1 Tax=Flavobacterium hydrocarbonoxydans TaxID=2683249 RepID=A0A6I4NF18_9FLAO|nr:manganese efflux pump [Flavobacterium hydrocarbonoxydans]MWB92798.1 hypothetical protein [Flavobacterium hydrocarbonoxydans]PAM91797.1 hypothetical protein B4N84_23495 [Flavobacterium sp. IR1]
MIKNTLNWYNGEIFEAKFILGFGIFTLICSLLFYFLGNTPKSKSLLIPMLIISVFFIVTGANMIYSNRTKIQEIETKYQQNTKEFVDAEIKRVEDFQYLYPLSIGISLVCFIVALGLLYFAKNIHLQAIAIALIFFGSAFAVIDYFSKERATIYYEKLVNFKL